MYTHIYIYTGIYIHILHDTGALTPNKKYTYWFECETRFTKQDE